MSNPVYLDCNATMPVKSEVIEAMAEAMSSVGNPSSIHAAGRAARRLMSQAREQVAALVGVPSDAVVFTSGGTEANNQALLEHGGPVLVSAIEHPSVLALAGDRLTVPVNSNGVIDLEALKHSLEKYRPTRLALMLANNETGVIQPVHEVAAVARETDVRLHIDGVQAAGKIPIDFFDIGADSLSLSAHKLGGPQGVGALVLKPGVEPATLLQGGSQERRYRPGTENLPGIVGFGVAANLARADQTFATRTKALRDRLEAEILALAPDAVVLGAGADRLPNTCCLALPGFGHDTQLIAYDLAGIAVSAGSACSSGKVGLSPVLEAMGVPAELASCAIRISFGWNSGPADVDRFVEACRDLLARRRLEQSA